MQEDEFGGQARPLKMMETAGYGPHEGICYGVAAEGLKALLLMLDFSRERKEGKKGSVQNPLGAFDKRWKIIQAADAKLEEVSSEVKIDILAFFKNVNHFQKAQSIKDLDNTEKVKSFSDMYGTELLTRCLEAFRQKLEFHNVNYPIPLLVSGAGHAITIGYASHHKIWILINGSRKRIKYIPEANDKDMAEAILLSFINNATKSEIALYIVSYLTSQHLEENPIAVDNALQAWESIYEKYADPEKVIALDSIGYSCLFLAAQHGDEERVAELIKKGAVINTINNAISSPLYVAAQNGHIGIVRLLLENGALVDYGNNDYVTPLYVSVLCVYLEIVKLLLTYKANVNRCDKKGRSPLYMAVMFGHSEIIKLIIATGEAKALIPAKNGNSPFLLALKNDNLEILKLLLTEKTVNCLTNFCESNSSSLAIAITQGHVEKVKLLLENNANVEPFNHKSYWPLYEAVSKHNKEIVELLLRYKADANKKYSEDFSPLLKAINDGDIDIVTLLLKYGANVNQPHKDFIAPLFVASFTDNLEMVKLLLEYGADVNQSFSEDRLPDVACADNKIRELLNAKMKPSILPKTAPLDHSMINNASSFWSVPAKNASDKNAEMSDQPQSNKTPDIREIKNAITAAFH
jgi:ankyrin repeat protein